MAPTPPPGGDDRLWTIDDIAAYLGISRRTAWDVVKLTGFPPRLIITAQTHRWQPAAVRRWATTRTHTPTASARRVDALA